MLSWPAHWSVVAFGYIGKNGQTCIVVRLPNSEHGKPVNIRLKIPVVASGLSRMSCRFHNQDSPPQTLQVKHMKVIWNFTIFQGLSLVQVTHGKRLNLQREAAQSCRKFRIGSEIRSVPTNFAVVVQQIGCPHDQRNGSLVGRLKLLQQLRHWIFIVFVFSMAGMAPSQDILNGFQIVGEKWHQCPTILEELHASIQSHMALVQSSSRQRSLVKQPNCLSFSVLDYNYNV